jgi:hypothetical protein
MRIAGLVIGSLVWGSLAGLVITRTLLARRLRSEHPAVWVQLGRPTFLHAPGREWSKGLSKLLEQSYPETLADSTIKMLNGLARFFVALLLFGLGTGAILIASRRLF